MLVISVWVSSTVFVRILKCLTLQLISVFLGLSVTSAVLSSPFSANVQFALRNNFYTVLKPKGAKYRRMRFLCHFWKLIFFVLQILKEKIAIFFWFLENIELIGLDGFTNVTGNGNDVENDDPLKKKNVLFASLYW